MALCKIELNQLVIGLIVLATTPVFADNMSNRLPLPDSAVVSSMPAEDSYYEQRYQFVFYQDIMHGLELIHKLDIVSQKIYANSQDIESLKKQREEIVNLYNKNDEKIKSKQAAFNRFISNFSKNKKSISHDVAAQKALYLKLRNIYSAHENIFEAAVDKKVDFPMLLGSSVIDRTRMFFEVEQAELKLSTLSNDKLDLSKYRTLIMLENGNNALSLLELINLKLARLNGTANNLDEETLLILLKQNINENETMIKKAKMLVNKVDDPEKKVAFTKVVINEENISKVISAYFNNTNDLQSKNSIKAWFSEFIKHLKVYRSKRYNLEAELGLVNGGDMTSDIFNEDKKSPIKNESNNQEKINLEKFFSGN